MVRDFPNPQAGQSWREQSAREWRNLSEEVRRLKGLIERQGLNLPSGALPRSDHLVPTRTRDELTVVIVREPMAEDATLLVREAKYINTPPKKCEGADPNVTCYYEWYGTDFEVYPPLGREAIDYEGDEYIQAQDDVPPKLDTVFHRCHREHNVWVLDLQTEGGASIAFVRIVDSVPPNSPSSKFLTVQPMKVDDIEGSPTFGKWIATTTGSEAAEVWPNYVAGHYLPMRFQTPDVIVPMTKVNGTQYVWQKNRMFLGQPLSSLPQSDCIVPIRP